jgi:hypothetical protein
VGTTIRVAGAASWPFIGCSWELGVLAAVVTADLVKSSEITLLQAADLKYSALNMTVLEQP